MSSWYSANKEAHKARMRARYVEKRDEINAAKRAKYAANQAHREELRGKQREYTRSLASGEKARRDRRNTYGTDGAELWTGKCGVCEVALDTLPKKMVHLDHCHSTGKVRGWLCGGCNTGLGHFRDNPQRLRAAADYIEKGNCK